MFNAKGTDDHLCEGLQSAHNQALVNAEYPVLATNHPPFKTGVLTKLVFLPSVRIAAVAKQQRKEQPLARSKLAREYPSVDSTQFGLENPPVTPGH
jgi:hypothetical protein